MQNNVLLIHNKRQLCNVHTKNALQILEAGLEAAKPDLFLSRFIMKGTLSTDTKSYSLSKFSNVYVVAVGKSSDCMAKHVCSKIKVDSGIIIMPQNYKTLFCKKNFRIIKAGHPIPNDSSIIAAKSIINLLKNTKKDDLVIFLVSGGGSSLVSLPAGITLRQKQRLTEILLKCGASIKEINAIRKHLSQVKGGRILEHLNCTAISYVMSDVVGDDLSAIASGLTYCDKTTYSYCLEIIRKYNLEKKLPRKILEDLRLGSKGKISETPKKPKIPNVVVATNNDCLIAMNKKSAQFGYKTKTLSSLTGNTNTAVRKILKNFSFNQKSCLVFGGETTVKVQGNGKGGRNQEMVLRLLEMLKENVVIAALGTDGIDGNTKEAGAIFYNIQKKLNIRKYLKNNDSNSFFRIYGGLIKTGPTHTNLLDIGLILKS